MAEKIKVLILNGSPRVDGNTSIALRELQKVFEANDVETEIVQIGREVIRGCIACNFCSKHGRCMISDIVKEGKQTMRTLARNMTFLMRSIALGKEKFGLPEKEEWIGTHFI